MKSLLTILTLLFLFSCSKENNEIKAEENDLVGTWSLYGLKLKSSTTGPLERDTTLVPCLKDVKLNFYKGGTVIQKFTGAQYCEIQISQGSVMGWYPTYPNQYGTWTQVRDTITVIMNNQINTPMKYTISNNDKKLMTGFSNTAGDAVTETWFIKN